MDNISRRRLLRWGLGASVGSFISVGPVSSLVAETEKVKDHPETPFKFDLETIGRVRPM